VVRKQLAVLSAQPSAPAQLAPVASQLRQVSAQMDALAKRLTP